MSALEKIRQWLATFPGNDRLRSLQVDYLATDPNTGSIQPSGLTEVSRKEDILGNVTAENQYNFGLYYTFVKATDDDAGATENAAWLMELQEWIQQQSIRQQAPTFGDDPQQEQIRAQNGTIYGVSEDGAAIYTVQLSINFTRKYEVNS